MFRGVIISPLVRVMDDSQLLEHSEEEWNAGNMNYMLPQFTGESLEPTLRVIIMQPKDDITHCETRTAR